jgi:hypothetical protein
MAQSLTDTQTRRNRDTTLAVTIPGNTVSAVMFSLSRGSPGAKF